MFKRFGGRRYVTLGLDLRPRGVRYACLQHDRHGPALIHQGTWEGDSTDEGLFRMARAVQSALRGQRIEPERIIVGLPRQWCFLKVLTFPKMADEDVRDALAFELERHLPVDPEALIYDYMVLGDKPGPDMAVLVCAVRRNLIEPLLSAWRAVDLAPEALVPSPLANGALLERCRPEVSQAPGVLLVEDDGQAVGVDFFEDGQLLSSQLFSLEGRVGTEAIASLQEAFSQTFAARLARFESPAALPWFFLGPSDSLVRQALQTLGLASPTPIGHQAIIQSPDGVEVERFHTAAGLALYGQRDTSIPMNLEPPPPMDAPPRRRLPRRAVLLASALVVALGLYGVITIRDHWELRRLKKAVTALQPEVEKVQRLENESSRLRAEMAAMESMAIRHPSVLQLLKELTLVIPASAWLTEARFNGRELLIGGYADSSQELIGLLEESPQLANIEFRGTITKRDGKERFKIAAETE